MNKIDIIKVTDHDLAILQEISQQTFIETYSADNSEGDMAKYLDEELSLKKLAKEVNDKESEFYFAKVEDEVIGYTKVRTERFTDGTCALEIKRIYVRQEFQGRKIGQLLFEKAVATAKEKDVDYVWLAVWEENLKAIRFYKRNGFSEFGKLVFVLGNDEQTGIKMKMPLKAS